MIESGKVTNVEEQDNIWVVKFDCRVFGLEKSYNIKPEIGDDIEVHIVNGSTVRGVIINDKEIYYKTDKELERENEQYKLRAKTDRYDIFMKNKDKMDAQFNNLPEVYQKHSNHIMIAILAHIQTSKMAKQSTITTKRQLLKRSNK